jgi:glycerate-2-kinase
VFDPAILNRLLDAARSADDPARRVVEALVDDPLFASWAAEEAALALDTPETARPRRDALVVHASGAASRRMRAGFSEVMGPRPVREGPAGPHDRLLVLLSPGGTAPEVDAGAPAPRPGAALALVLGTPDPDQVEWLAGLGAVVRRLGEDRSVLAVVQGAAREEGLTPVVLHRHLRGSAQAAGRGLARAALAVAGGVGGVDPPACLLLLGDLRAEGDSASAGDPAAAVEEAAGRALLAAAGSGEITAGAVVVGAGIRPRVLALALVP